MVARDKAVTLCESHLGALTRCRARPRRRISVTMPSIAEPAPTMAVAVSAKASIAPPPISEPNAIPELKPAMLRPAAASALPALRHPRVVYVRYFLLRTVEPGV